MNRVQLDRLVSVVLLSSMVLPTLALGGIPRPLDRTLLNEERSCGRNEGMVVGFVEGLNKSIKTYGGVESSEIFEIGSLTKVFTSVALGVLIHEGKVKLEDQVSQYLPELSNYSTGRITLKELATHTSGLFRDPSDLNHKNPNPYQDYSEKDLIQYLKRIQISRQEHSSQYSNLGMALLAHVLTQVTGETYEDLIRDTITDPLGMRDTRILLSKKQKALRALGHDCEGCRASFWDLDIFEGAGGLKSTVEDLLLFAQANLNPPRGSLGEGIRLAQEIHHLSANSESGHSKSGDSSSYQGLGWVIQNTNSNQILWHNGLTGGFSSLIGIDPTQQKAVVILKNTASICGSQYLAQAFSGTEFRDSSSRSSVPPTSSSSSASQRTWNPEPRRNQSPFVGLYQIQMPSHLPQNFQIEITQHPNGLWAQGTNQPMFQLTPIGPNQYSLMTNNGPAQIQFVEGQYGAPPSLILYQHGTQFRGTKLNYQPLPSNFNNSFIPRGFQF